MSSAGLFPKSAGVAVFSSCNRYRYSLWRIWNPNTPVCVFLMLNPLPVTETQNDPTIERCQRRSLAMGYGGLNVGNIFAWRSKRKLPH
jgi:hypothetical protein